MHITRLLLQVIVAAGLLSTTVALPANPDHLTASFGQLDINQTPQLPIQIDIRAYRGVLGLKIYPGPVGLNLPDDTTFEMWTRSNSRGGRNERIPKCKVEIPDKFRATTPVPRVETQILGIRTDKTIVVLKKLHDGYEAKLYVWGKTGHEKGNSMNVDISTVPIFGKSN
jgi:hypothetical protein